MSFDRHNHESGGAVSQEQFNELQEKYDKLAEQFEETQAKLDAVLEILKQQNGGVDITPAKMAGSVAVKAAKAAEATKDDSTETDATTVINKDDKDEDSVSPSPFGKVKPGEGVQPIGNGDEAIDAAYEKADDDDEEDNRTLGERFKDWRHNAWKKPRNRILAFIGGVAIALAVGGGVGYAIGNNMAQYTGSEQTVEQQAQDTGSEQTTEQQTQDTSSEQTTNLNEEEKKWSDAASKMHLDVNTVKTLASQYGVSLDNLAQPGMGGAEMRDSAKAGCVSEAMNFQDETSAIDKLRFVGYTNPQALAMYMGGIKEDAAIHDEGVDGLQNPQDIVNLNEQYMNNQDLLNADVETFENELDGATVTLRDATDDFAYSYGITNDNELVCTSGPENSYGENTKIADITFASGAREAIKDSCGQTMARGKRYTVSTPSVVRTTAVRQHVRQTAYGGGSSTTTTTTNNGGGTPDQPNNPPVTPPGTDLEPKNEHDNDAQQNAANGENGKSSFNDNAEATKEPQTYVDKNGQAAPSDIQEKAQQNAGNIDGDATNGSEYVPKADEQGNINGSQGNTAPNWQDWSSSESGEAKTGSEA